MSTLGAMKDRIARETRRTNIGTQIAEAINTAIECYQGERFWFNVSREGTFATVANQEFYSNSDDTDIGNIEKIDYIEMETADLQTVRLYEDTPERIERLSLQGTNTGEPRYYCFYDGRVRLYPVPDDVYTIRVAGVIRVLPPATDGEVNNPWMIEGERLIRMRALFELYSHVIVDVERAQITASALEDALSKARSRTARKVATGGWAMTPTDW